MRFPFWTNSQLESAELDAEVSEQLQPLVYDHELYFDMGEGTLIVDIASLAASRARPTGVVNANAKMREAADGHRSKRAPVDIEETAEGLLVVVDGNSTFINAVFSQWSDLPCTLKLEKSEDLPGGTEIGS